MTYNKIFVSESKVFTLNDVVAQQESRSNALSVLTIVFNVRIFYRELNRDSRVIDTSDS